MHFILPDFDKDYINARIESDYKTYIAFMASFVPSGLYTYEDDGRGTPTVNFVVENKGTSDILIGACELRPKHYYTDTASQLSFYNMIMRSDQPIKAKVSILKPEASLINRSQTSFDLNEDLESINSPLKERACVATHK